MIVTVPENKKIHNTKKLLNESLFDDFEEDFDDNPSSTMSTKITKEYEEETLVPKVKRILDELEVYNYTITCTGHGILVDVHDNLYLANKKLNRLGTLLFKFNLVEGNCNYTGNKLTDWTMFPNTILGNCYANFNNIYDFTGAPYIKGRLIASKQNKKTKYPLTDDNYKRMVLSSSKLHENDVYVISALKYGKLYSINENNDTCVVVLETDNKKYKYKLNDVELLGNIENLLI